MEVRVPYGTNEILEVESTSTVVLAHSPGADASPIKDVDAATREVLANPLELPPLAQCITGSDRVVLALRRGTPRGSEILAAIARYLLPFLSADGQLTILRTELDANAGRGDPRPYLSAKEQQSVEIRTHCVDHQEEFALLARFHNGRPLRLHRVLVDADVVIPVGWSQPGGAWGVYGTSGAVFPGFSDRLAQLTHWREVVRSSRSKTAPTRGRSRRYGQIGSEASWLLGTQFAVEVIPGACENILKVVAGTTIATKKAARADYRKWWCPEVERKTDLVIAGVDHEPAHTAWENLAQAAWSAARLVRRGGRIVLVTDWYQSAESLPINERSLAETAGVWSWSDFLQQHGDLGVPFWLLARVRNHASLCLWTSERLADESLGGWRDRLSLETASGTDVIKRLMDHVSSCTVFSHASLAWPRVTGETPPVKGGLQKDL